MEKCNRSIYQAVCKTLWLTPLAAAFLISSAQASSSYNLSTFVDMNPGTSFATQYCPLVNGVNTCAVEGSAVGQDGNLYLSMALPKGKIIQVKPDGSTSIYATIPISNADPTAVDFHAVNLRLAVDKEGNLYAPFRDVDPSTFVPSPYHGVWKIPVGGGNCDLNSGPCTKIWPTNASALPTPLRFPDGIVLDGKGNFYLADAQMGNIWKVNIATKSGFIWSGTEASSSPNYLQGNSADFLLGGPDGRGLGIIGLTMDAAGKNIYGSNFDNGRVIQIPINKDGSAGKQKLLFDLSNQDKQFDAIFLDNNSNTLYVTQDQVNFIAFANTLNCSPDFSNPCHVFFGDGHQIWAKQLGSNGDFYSLINDTRLGVTTSVVTGFGDNTDDLYIDVFSSNDGTGPKIIRATKD